MSLKWKEIYNNNKQRRYCDFIKIKEADVELESNSLKLLKEKKYYIIVISLIIFLILLYTFKNNIRVLFMVAGFCVLAGICFFVFNYFKLKCTKEGLYIKFGLQSGIFSYEKIKSIYISRFNDYSFLLPSKGYSIVIRYIDNFNRIKELSFSTNFLDKQETINFLENFEIENVQNQSYISFERFKLLKKLGKIAIIIFLCILLFAFAFIPRT